MSENQQNIQCYENEIDLNEFFSALWRRKIVIISSTLIFTILAGIFSVFILSPVYNTKLNIVISMPETYNTKYGEYNLPITTNDQYISLLISNDVILNTIKDMGYEDTSVEDIKKRISLGNFISTPNFVQNSFDINISADNPEESLRLAKSLFKNYLEFMDVMTKERATSYYYNKFSVDLKSQETYLKSEREILKKNEEILLQTPQTINQKDAMKEIQGQLTNTSEFVVLENIINPNYIEIQKKIIENKQRINTIEDVIRVCNDNLVELNKEKEALDKYYKTGKVSKLESELTGVVDTSIYLPSPPVAPSHKTSPSNAKNVVIGFGIGLILGVCTALIKEYWLKKV